LVLGFWSCGRENEIGNRGGRENEIGEEGE